MQGRSDIEQMSKVFGLLGTPSEETWPSWREMPDAEKLIFDETEPLKEWSNIRLFGTIKKKIEITVSGASPQFIKFLKLHLKLDAKKRSMPKSLLETEYMRVRNRNKFAL